MSTSPILQKLIAKAQRTDLPPFHAGDTVRVHVKIKEGDKERLQAFEGVVIARSRGAQPSFTVRKISFGHGVERIFPLNSKVIDKIEVLRSGARPPRQAVLPPRPPRQGCPPARSGVGSGSRRTDSGTDFTNLPVTSSESVDIRVDPWLSFFCAPPLQTRGRDFALGGEDAPAQAPEVHSEVREAGVGRRRHAGGRRGRGRARRILRAGGRRRGDSRSRLPHPRPARFQAAARRPPRNPGGAHQAALHRLGGRGGGRRPH